jgi:hypothetical protein
MAWRRLGLSGSNLKRFVVLFVNPYDMPYPDGNQNAFVDPFANGGQPDPHVCGDVFSCEHRL